MTSETESESAASNEAQTAVKAKKTATRVKKTEMKYPDAFTIKELMVLNNEPKRRYNTIYQRVQVDVKKGILVESATIKNGDGKGRAEVVYKLANASPNNILLNKAASQGRLKSQAVVSDAPVETPVIV